MIDHDASQSDKFIGTTAAIISAIGAATTAGASIYGAHKQAGAASDAAKLTTDAANHAADVQARSNAEALAFERQQADYQAREMEVDRRANYDQQAAKLRRIGSIGQMLGLGGVEIPAYVPSAPANFSAGPPAPGAPAAGLPTAPPMPASFGAMLDQPGRVPTRFTPRAGPAPLAFASSMPSPYGTFGQYLGA